MIGAVEPFGREQLAARAGVDDELTGNAVELHRNGRMAEPVRGDRIAERQREGCGWRLKSKPVQDQDAACEIDRDRIAREQLGPDQAGEARPRSAVGNDVGQVSDDRRLLFEHGRADCDPADRDDVGVRDTRADAGHARGADDGCVEALGGVAVDQVARAGVEHERPRLPSVDRGFDDDMAAFQQEGDFDRGRKVVTAPRCCGGHALACRQAKLTLERAGGRRQIVRLDLAGGRTDRRQGGKAHQDEAACRRNTHASVLAGNQTLS